MAESIVIKPPSSSEELPDNILIYTEDEGTVDPVEANYMLASTYDPQGMSQDVFAYVDTTTQEALAYINENIGDIALVIDQLNGDGGVSTILDEINGEVV